MPIVTIPDDEPMTVLDPFELECQLLEKVYGLKQITREELWKRQEGEEPFNFCAHYLPVPRWDHATKTDIWEPNVWVEGRHNLWNLVPRRFARNIADTELLIKEMEARGYGFYFTRTPASGKYFAFFYTEYELHSGSTQPTLPQAICAAVLDVVAGEGTP